MEPREEDPLHDVADAIVDGRDVPWETLETASDPATEPLIREFRVLAALAGVHRQTHDTIETGQTPLGGPSPLRLPEAADLPVSWGPFELRAVLGSGSFGTVYRARDPKLERDIAVKLAQTSDAAGLDRVVAEGRRLARVRHPNVITVFGADVFDGTAGIWMELLEGHTLQEELRNRGPLGAREAALVGIDLCQALAAVHAAGVVHRDIKPQNVMRQQGGRIVLMDFGAGRDLARADGQAGTPLYMAPELLSGGSASASSDIYSVGVLLFHLVTREFPVSALTLDELSARHAAGERRRLRDVRPDLPSAFIRAVEHASAPNSAERPASAAEFEEALESVVVRRQQETTATASRLPGAVLVAALLLLVSLVVWRADSLFTPAPTMRSIAVLPFEHPDGREDQAAIAEGLTQLITSNLEQMQSLRVIAQTSARVAVDRAESTAGIASQLSVDGLVMGSVEGREDRVRVNVRLLRANGSTLWTHDYERPASDVGRIPGEVSVMVADAIRVSLTKAERRELQESVVSVAAQDAFLRGLYRMNDHRPETLRLAHADLVEAARLDPRSARIQAALSRCYVRMAARGIMTHAEAYPRALAAATTAVQLDDRVADAHTQLAEVKFYYEYQWDLAEREYERALELSPSNSHAIARYALFLAAADKTHEALERATLALSLDPLSGGTRTGPGMALHYARRYEESVAAFQQLLTLPPYALFATDRVGLARSYAAIGRHDEAIAELQSAITQEGPQPPWVAEVARIHAEAGRQDEARRWLRSLYDAGAMDTYPANLGLVHVALGEIDEAFEAFDRAVDVRAQQLLWIKVDPRFDAVRNDPRFANLLARIGLPR
jgi:serine/threonine protein kinase/tetratricopeptide (TPR) repeat protein